MLRAASRPFNYAFFRTSNAVDSSTDGASHVIVRRVIGFLYLLFFCSGLSGLIYQVVWIRVLGNVFGNTIYSASIVIAVFMLGLGVGSYVVGVWADRRYVDQPNSLIRTYGHFELLIGVMGFGISALLPQLSRLSAIVSSY